MAVQAACDQKSLLETVRKYTRNTPAALEILRSSPCRSTTWGPGMIPRHGTGSFGSSLSKESRGHCSVPQVSGSLGHCSVVPQVSGSLGHWVTAVFLSPGHKKWRGSMSDGALRRRGLLRSLLNWHTAVQRLCAVFPEKVKLTKQATVSGWKYC